MSFDYVQRLSEDREAATFDEWAALRQRLLETIRDSGDAVSIEASATFRSLMLPEISELVDGEDSSPQ